MDLRDQKRAIAQNYHDIMKEMLEQRQCSFENKDIRDSQIWPLVDTLNDLSLGIAMLNIDIDEAETESERVHEQNKKLERWNAH